MAKAKTETVEMIPKRRKHPPRDAMSVYPPRTVQGILGSYRSTPFTQAIRCWCKLLEMATKVVSSLLSPEEWEFLAAATAGRLESYDPDWNNPNNLIVQNVEQAVIYEVSLDKLAKKNIPEARNAAAALIKKIQSMDYLHAWATIWTLQYRDSLVKPEGEWWTLAHRHKTVNE